jgi:hypothetical protein
LAVRDDTGRFFASAAPAKAIERQEDDRGCEEGQELARCEPADDGDAERPTKFSAVAEADRQR